MEQRYFYRERARLSPDEQACKLQALFRGHLTRKAFG